MYSSKIMTMRKKIIVIMLALLALVLCVAAAPQTTEDAGEAPALEATILEISKYGNIVLSISPDSMRELGYEPADLILVRIGSAEMEMPIGTSYTDADSGEPICC